MASLLIADDEKNILSGLRLAFEDEGYTVITASDGKEAWEKLQKNIVDLVITDLRMPEMDGYELLKRISSSYPTLPVIVLTGHGTIETAVETMRDGAIDFFTKPVDIDKLSLVVRKSITATELKEQNRKLSEELKKLRREKGYSKIVGRSQKVVDMLRLIEQVADTRATVLITGESGTGKELVADALVALSSRSDKPFVKVHAASLSSSLLEDELFGIVRDRRNIGEHLLKILLHKTPVGIFLDFDQVRHVEDFIDPGKAHTRLFAHLHLMHHRVHSLT